jgi:Zn-finger nucleic acid-binding protein
MYSVPTEGPEVDVCRGCQLMWFDAAELSELPHRSEAELEAARKAEDRNREGQEWRQRRERDEEFLAWVRRHPVGFIAL